MNELWRRLWMSVRWRQFDRDLEEEMRFHLEMKARRNREAGMDDGAARLAAQRQFGSAALASESSREAWSFAFVESVLRDVHYAARSLGKARAFSAVAVASLALGIGANTALFSLMDVMLLRALPVRNPRRLVEFVRVDPPSMMSNVPFSVFTHFEQDRGVLEDVFAVYSSSAVFRAGERSENVTAHLVTESFFPALGVSAMLGRTIGAEDRVTILSHAFWTRRFGQSPSVLGSTVQVNGEPFLVVGVMPPRFFGVDRSRLPDLWLPFPAGARDASQAWVLGHLKPGISIPQARAALTPLFRQALDSHRERISTWTQRDQSRFLAQELYVYPASSGTVDLNWTYWKGRNTLKILAALTCLVLLIACANLASLLAARSTARSREIGIRLAIGSGRWRLVRQLMTENLLLALVGCALGMLIAAGGHRLLLSFLVRDPQAVALDFRLDYRVLCFGLGVSVVTCLLFGLLPVIRATRTDLARAMHAEAPARGPAGIPLARALLAVQVAFSMVLLAGAGLFSRSLWNLGAAGLGLQRDNLFLVDVRPSARTPQALRQFWHRAMERISTLPAVHSAALAGDAVFGNGGWNQDIWIDRGERAPTTAKVSDNVVSAGFFATAGIPVLMGREFTERDREGAPLAALVNQTFARQHYGEENPIGKRFGDRGSVSKTRYEIVGVVGDAKYGTVREPIRPMVFYPLLQYPPRGALVLHARAWQELAVVEPSIRRELSAIDPECLVSDARTLPQVIRKQLRQDRMFAALAGFFALLALALGAVGIYGIVAYGTTRRIPEIGLRVALGASRLDVLWLVVRETTVLLVAGTVAGVFAALVAARWIASMLFALEPTDPATFACATAALLMVGILAGLLPARRAARVEPMAALRSE